MKDTPDYNILFVSIIEKYKIVYDHTCAEYSDRNKQEKAWTELAKEINESGKHKIILFIFFFLFYFFNNYLDSLLHSNTVIFLPRQSSIWLQEEFA